MINIYFFLITNANYFYSWHFFVIIVNMKRRFELGDNIDIPQDTIVKIHNEKPFVGKIVGKATTDITQSHIVKCIDSTYPNDDYRYNTLVVLLTEIEILK